MNGTLTRALSVAAMAAGLATAAISARDGVAQEPASSLASALVFHAARRPHGLLQRWTDSPYAERSWQGTASLWRRRPSWI